MQREKRSKIWKLPPDELQIILNNSNSLKEVLIAIGMNPSCGNYKTLNLRLQKDNLDLNIFNKNREQLINSNLLNMKRHTVDNDEVFIKNSTYTNTTYIKKRMLNLGFPYICNECGILEYNNKPISLQLDHINGINDDNRLENLRFLCPNCHSQTDTFSGKKHKKQYICKCGRGIQKFSTHCNFCRSSKIVWPSVEEMRNLVWETPSSVLANKLGVSDTAIKKFCRKNNIEKPSRGYWTLKTNGVSDET